MIRNPSLLIVTAIAATVCASLCSHSLAQQPSLGLVTRKVHFSALRPGYVSLEGIVTYEDIEKLSPTMARAVKLLRTGRYQQAQTSFQRIQHLSPIDPLSFRGENEAAHHLGTLSTTVAYDRRLLAALYTSAMQSKTERLAVINYALGDALMLQGYTPRFVGDNPKDLPPEIEQRFQEAINLNPHLFVAYLALAAYYEHPSQQHGDKARLEYEQALRLRPDLYQIRYLHAASWDRPMYIPPQEEAQLAARGFTVQGEQKMQPRKAIAECLRLIQDHPHFSPPYLLISHNYAAPLGDQPRSRKYLAIYNRLMARKLF